MNPKRQYPAYDSEAACLVSLAAMVFCFWFGAVGYMVSQSDPLSGRHVWVPVFIMVASAFVIVSTTVRLVQRYYKQRKRASIRP